MTFTVLGILFETIYGCWETFQIPVA